MLTFALVHVQVTVNVQLAREEQEGMNEGAGLGAVHAPLYPKPKTEGWWLVVGDPADNSLKAIKRVTLGQKARVALEFDAPEEEGEYNYVLYLMCDSYLGCDQEFEVELKVAKGESESEEESDDDEDI